MKNSFVALVILSVLLTFSSCGNGMVKNRTAEVKKSAPQKTADEKEPSPPKAAETSSVKADVTDSVKEKETLAQKDDLVDITEKMYVTYINDIYTNVDDYIGKTIRLEGMFSAEYMEETKKTYFYVYRTGPGCCANDGSMCGFEFTCDGEMPKENDWIEVTGKLHTYEEDKMTYLSIAAASVKVLEKRGAETLIR